MTNKPFLLIFYFYLDEHSTLDEFNIHFKCLEYFKYIWNETIFIIIGENIDNDLMIQLKLRLSNIFYDINISFMHNDFYNNLQYKLTHYDGYVMHANSLIYMNNINNLHANSSSEKNTKDSIIIAGYYFCYKAYYNNMIQSYLENNKLIYLSYYFFNMKNNTYSPLSFYIFDNQKLLTYFKEHQIKIKSNEIDNWYYKYIDNDQISFYENFIFRNKCKIKLYYEIYAGANLLCSYNSYNEYLNCCNAIL